MSLGPTQLIRIDWIGGTTAGALMLILCEWLSGLYGLPASLVLTIGLANLAYGAVSFTLAASTTNGHVPFLRGMAMANLSWTLVCLALAATWFATASWLGMAHLVGEAAFVGGLGILEWRADGRIPACERMHTDVI